MSQTAQTSNSPKSQISIKQSEPGSFMLYVSGGTIVVADDLERSDIEFTSRGMKIAIKAKAVNVIESTETNCTTATVRKSRTPDKICIELPKGWNIGYGG